MNRSTSYLVLMLPLTIFSYFFFCGFIDIKSYDYRINSFLLKQENRERDSLALVVLYESTNGEEWTNSWDLDQPMDTWFGVTLDENGCVTVIELRSNNLKGSLPSEIGQLNSLTELYLNGNYITKIPPEIGQLDNLNGLYLTGNQILEIPPEIGQLSNLGALYLSGNLISFIPLEIGQLSDLRILHVNDNNLTGKIPEEIGQLKSLFSLQLANNNLSDSIPPIIGNLTSLSSLSLCNNFLTGSIPVEFGNLVNLRRLDLQNNKLVGKIPAELGNLNNLERLNLWNNNLNNCFASDLKNICSIGESPSNGGVDANGYWIKGNPLLPWQGDFSKFCETDGSLGVQIGVTCDDGDSTTINDIIQADCSCKGESISQNCSNTNHPDYDALMALYNSTIGENWINNDGWKEGAEDTSCDPCNWNGGTWFGLECQNERVVKLLIPENNLTGELPIEIGGLNELIELSMGGNSFSGTIPTEIASLPKLFNLFLWGNNLSGEIPTELANNTSIGQISLEDNILSGSLPEGFANLPILEFLQLENNQLSGCYPESYTSICNIRCFFEGNLSLPWQGDFQLFCNGEEQIGAVCDDGNPDAINNIIQDDCSCRGESIIADCANTKHPDYDALINLYNSTQGPRWKIQDGWLEGAAGESCDPCNFNGGTWYGIRCENNRVTVLDMFNSFETGGNNLTGEIPDLNLSELKILDFRENNLTGEIPDFSYLGNLQNFSCIDNDLTGEIPDFLNIPNLIDFYCGSNSLIGEIPNFINLPNLKNFSCGVNQLSGSIPDFSNLSNLELFSCINNNLDSIPDFSNLPNLVYLRCNKNEIKGTLPNFSNCPNLFQIICSDNQLSGNIPPFDNCPKLVEVFGENNQFSGCFPEEFKNTLCLNSYYFLNNPELPWNGDMVRFCGGEEYSGCLENDITSCRYQDSLALVALFNSTGGAAWTYEGNQYYIGREQNTGDVQFEDIVNQGNRWDFNTPISTWHGVEVNSLGCVTKLTLPNCNLIGSIPDTISALAELTVLSLDGNKLTTIPSKIGLLTNLSILSIVGNDLNDTIPKEIGNLSNLTILELCNNELTGKVPSELGNLSNLLELRIGSNSFTSKIPPELGNLQNLRLFSAFSCGLVGELPYSLGELQNIELIDLTTNNLSGCFPENYIQFCLIEYAGFTNNPVLPGGGDFDAFCSNNTGICAEETCRSLDSLDLVALYNSTNGANWVNPWVLTNPMDTWDGVTLNEIGCVTSLALNNDSLNGTLPHFHALSELIDINLSANQLEGEVPSFTNSPKLAFIRLSWNQFSSVNDSIAFLPIQRLWLGNNQLTEIPDLSSITQWNGTANEPALSLNDNRLTFEDLIKNVSIFNNYPFTVYQPQAYIYPDTIFSVNLGNSLNIDLGIDENIPNNKYTWFKDNVSFYTTITGNNKLEFTNIQFSEEGDYRVEVTNPELPDLSLFSNNIEIIVNQNCRHRDSLSLVALYDSTGGANWTIPWDLEQPISIWNGVTLNENGCVIKIYLAGNELRGNLPPQIGNLSELIDLQLNDNFLTGNIPKELGNLFNLSKLHLSVNFLNGEIPKELSNLSELTILYLNNNSLTGKIPKEFRNLSKLTTLYLAVNSLVGDIPPELGELTNLEYLTLNINSLSGNIPSELGNLINLKELKLNTNNLSGCYPSTLKKLCYLTSEPIINCSWNNNFLENCQFDFRNNPQLPWQGDFVLFCNTNGLEKGQVGAPCDDGNPNTSNDIIQLDCSCQGEFIPDCSNLPTELQDIITFLIMQTIIVLIKIMELPLEQAS